MAKINIIDWFGGNRSINSNEEVIGLGSHDKTLTIITCPSIIYDTYLNYVEHEDYEKDLIDGWYRASVVNFQ